MKAKLKTSLFLLIGTMIITLSACTKSPPPIKGWKIYKNKKDGFQFSYPPKWKKRVGKPASPVVAVFEDASGVPAVNVAIDSAGNMSLEGYIDKSKEKLESVGFGIEVSKEKYLDINDRKAHEWIIKVRVKDKVIKEKQAVFVVNSKGYVVTIADKEDTFSKNEKTFDKIINSFVID